MPRRAEIDIENKSTILTIVRLPKYTVQGMIPVESHNTYMNVHNSKQIRACVKLTTQCMYAVLRLSFVYYSSLGKSKPLEPRLGIKQRALLDNVSKKHAGNKIMQL